MLTRRSFMTAAGASVAMTGIGLPTIAFGRSNSDRRFVFIIQRGAADGLHIVAPTGDPAYAAIRGDFASDLSTGANLDGFFTLHPALAQTAKMFAEKQALFAHAVASPYRDRSHFDGQNVLESGGSAAYRLKDGWMNRLLGLLPASEATALALAPTIPLALRGGREVFSYASSGLARPSDNLLERVDALYRSDAQLHGLWAEASEIQRKAGVIKAANRGHIARATGALAAQMLVGDGPRVAMIETNGWDTHSGQRTRLAGRLRDLDELLAAMKAGLGVEWATTLVIVATEFGRTVRPNGTGGTDHGEASVAMLLGGPVAGGKVIADWPGLRASNLYEGRDLRPTGDLDSIIAGALAHHYAVEPALMISTLFPANSGRAPRQGLLVS